jgi:FkbM family methyltransferase
MGLLVASVRTFNRRFPWHQPKPSLARWCDARLARTDGLQRIDDVQGNLSLELDLGRDLDRLIYLHTYEMSILTLMRRLLRSGDTFIDGGANLGLLSLLASRLVGPKGRVVAVEPFPAAIERLRRNIAANDASNITVHEAAAWDGSGVQDMFEFADTEIDGMSLGRRSDRDVARSWTVPTVRIDELVEGPVRLIKLDVEGAEWPALRGAARLLTGSHPPHVLVELKVSTAEAFGYHPMELVDWLTAQMTVARMDWMKSRRRRPIRREELASLLKREPDKSINILFTPCDHRST